MLQGCSPAWDTNRTGPRATGKLGEAAREESWRPVEGAERVASGFDINWEAPADGMVYYAETYHQICFLTDWYEEGDRFSVRDYNVEETVEGLLKASIVYFENEGVLPKLQFELFFLPDEKRKM